jgi:thiosulfate reductase cytochrome b subunit
MFTPRHSVRQGLPRVSNGGPWPPADTAVPVEDMAAGPASAPELPHPAEPVPVSREEAARLRQGLPRTAGGEPWPDAGLVTLPYSAQPLRSAVVAPGASVDAAGQTIEPARPVTANAVGASPTLVGGPGGRTAAGELRQGLPRLQGGAPWPAADVVAAVKAKPAPVVHAPVTETASPASAAADAAPGRLEAASATQRSRMGGARPATSQPAASTPTPREASKPASPQPRSGDARKDVKRYGPYTAGQWAGVAALGVVGVVVVLGGLVLLVRFLLGVDPIQDFMARYPGEYHLPETTPVGFPAWLGWQHFFNAFLMLLIIRTGIQIRSEKRPTAYWTPKNGSGGKVSLTVWLHQSMDLLWLLNGVVFVVLLLVTGHWARIVPTSWEVFPNALSAMLQYISLDWPTENGWVNYNSLQQLAYFTTVFIAAPLSAITGYRMSALWPKDSVKLNKAFPVEWARKLHFPVMLYFVGFIVIHVSLVFATGALRNLNHMYAAQGSVDGVAFADNWTGFWIFVVSLVVMAAGWIAARPMVVAPIARLFGTVSSR